MSLSLAVNITRYTFRCGPSTIIWSQYLLCLKTYKTNGGRLWCRAKKRPLFGSLHSSPSDTVLFNHRLAFCGPRGGACGGALASVCLPIYATYIDRVSRS